MAAVLVAPELDLHQVLQHQAQQPQMVPGHRHLALDAEAAAEPHPVPDRVILLVVPWLRALVQVLSLEAHVRPRHGILGVGTTCNDFVEARRCLHEEFGQVAHDGNGLGCAVAIVIRLAQAERQEHVVTHPNVVIPRGALAARPAVQGPGEQRAARDPAAGEIESPVPQQQALYLLHVFLRQQVIPDEGRQGGLVHLRQHHRHRCGPRRPAPRSRA
mmetsp:Transcript_91455/g.279897  ORF Transcript_91455/g.279897 Transcript_91455/m.279897 type:complete len:216 (-) Transcript_91455:23-670(-)